MKKIIALLLVIAVGFSFVLAGCKEEGPKKVRLSEVTRSVFYAPQYVALSKGFFKEEGLEIELSTGQGADKVMTAVLSNQVDIGFSGPEAAIYVYNEGKEDYPIVFAQLTNRDGSFLVGKDPDPDFDWSHVKGKTIIGGRKGGVPNMTLEYVLKKHGIMPGTDVNVDTSIQFSVMAGAFTGTDAEYVALFEPTASLVEKEGKGYVLTSIGKDSGEISYTAYYAKKSYIDKNKDTIQKFTNAIYKGQLWVKEHTPEEVAEAIQSFFPDTDLELLKMVTKRYKEIEAWNTDPILKKASFDLLQEVMQTAGELDETVPYEKLSDTSFAEKAIKDIK